MRVLPPAMAQKLASGVTTLCWCWRLDRADGVRLGFTDHDQTIAFDGVDYQAASARLSGDLEQSAAFSSDMSAVSGVLSADAITESDIANGRYDDAEIRLYRVDWAKPASRILIWRGVIGEIRRGELGFEVELRGLASMLERSVGRVLQRRCDAELGDARCGVDLESTAHKGAGAATGVFGARRFTVSGLSAFATDWFANGVLTWTSGANAGASARVEAHASDGAQAVIVLQSPPASPVEVGDGFAIVAGCDKRWRSCRDKFSNVVNFRGFPMSPGDDWIFAGPNAATGNNGGSLWTDREG